MLFTHSDPRAAWRDFCSGGDAAALHGLPAGAREAPLDWVCTTRVEERGHFDKDAQGEVFSTFTTVTGWQAADEVDPRIHLAGALSFHVDSVNGGVFSAFPGLERFGSALSALTLEGSLLFPTVLTGIGATRPWRDLAIWGARWSPPARIAGMRELATAFPGLLGLELQTVDLEPADFAALAAAPFLGQLEDFSLTNRRREPEGLRAVVERLGSLVHLDLTDADQGPALMGTLAPKLRRARRIKLSFNPIGDAGLRALLEAGALDQVEDLWLDRCELTDLSLAALVEASPTKLRGLWLHSNAFTDEGLEALVRSPLFARLEGLSLFQRGLTPRAEKMLEGHALAGALNGTTRLPGVGALWFLGR